MNYDILIKKAKENSLEGKLLDRETLIALLEIDPDSKAVEKLGESAREVASKFANNKGSVWASIGIDYQPCKMNCSFCSFGVKWGAITNRYQWGVDDIIQYTGKFVSEGAKWVTLRTTECFRTDNLCSLAKKVRSNVLGNYELVANTGELNDEKAKLLYESGFKVVYHSIRLREGIDTPFNVNERCKTLEAVRSSNLTLAYLVEPIGVEHSNEEIADVFLTAMRYGAKLTGAMARVPVSGTPLFKYGALPERRLAQITAVTRLGAGKYAPDICVHPPSKLAMEWGANVVVIETGAIPRDIKNIKNEWGGFDMSTAKKWYEETGYEA
ncbi:radical SAM protein [Pelotomaculum propionicicum]|uniref:Biotin synthase n=1 Tax=Pelotomaculum propionicicum TaxID=258475 RepID=A0A4Y7RVG9_9FIRM|nr:radical SAM protein [Pelotomaculum propionicicum]NLI11729.1 radical SAM protein [Peptococcaceae bacterium]TEB12985.1 Biotin synthase [Pelotomaculum propionicicum]